MGALLPFQQFHLLPFAFVGDTLPAETVMTAYVPGGWEGVGCFNTLPPSPDFSDFLIIDP